LGEFDGLGLPLANRTGPHKANWNFRKLNTRSDLTAPDLKLIDKLQPRVASSGLLAAAHTDDRPEYRSEQFDDR
jgi:hypothetical protein